MKGERGEERGDGRKEGERGERGGERKEVTVKRGEGQCLNYTAAAPAARVARAVKDR